MASAFTVVGPATLEIAGSVVGLSDNDDLFTIDFETRNEILEATDTGREPGEIVYVGQIAIISGVLAKWDKAQLTELLTPPGGSTEGDAGTIGTLWIGGSKTFTCQVGPQATPTATNPAYLFGRCFLDGPGSMRIFDFGNISRKLGFQIVAMRDGSDNIYTEVTA